MKPKAIYGGMIQKIKKDRIKSERDAAARQENGSQRGVGWNNWK